MYHHLQVFGEKILTPTKSAEVLLLNSLQWSHNFTETCLKKNLFQWVTDPLYASLYDHSWAYP